MSPIKDVSGTQWAVQGGHVGLYGPLAGRKDSFTTPDAFSPTPGSTPDPVLRDESPQEAPSAGPESPH